MGNWRTVRIVGSCPPDQVEALVEACRYYGYEGSKRRQREGIGFDEAMGATHCLAISDGLCGLGHWPAPEMDVGGNLFERNFDVEDVRRTLEELAEVAPGLAVKVHCGDEYESELCVATVTLVNGKASTDVPEIPRVSGVSQAELDRRFLRALTGRGG